MVRGQPKLAMVIPAFNEARHIARVLEALRGSSVLDEIVVVDDASTDGTWQEVQKA